MDAALPSVRLPESVTAVALLFQMAPLKLAASCAEPVPFRVRALVRLKPLTSSRPELEGLKSAIVAPAVAFWDNVTWVALSMLTIYEPAAMPVPVTVMPFCIAAVEVIPVTTAEPATVVAAAWAPTAVPPMVTTPPGKAPAWPSIKVPPWTTRSPVNVPAVALSAPRNKVPCPALTKALVAVVPEPRPVPLCVIGPSNIRVPAPALAVLAVARIAPLPMVVEPAAPNQPVPKLPVEPLIRLRVAFAPMLRVFVGATTAPNCVAKVSIVAVVEAAKE